MFVSDFKKCDTDNSWDISADQAKRCMPEQNWMKALAVKGRNDKVLEGFMSKEDAYDELFQQVDRDGSEGINFAE